MRSISQAFLFMVKTARLRPIAAAWLAASLFGCSNYGPSPAAPTATAPSAASPAPQPSPTVEPSAPTPAPQPLALAALQPVALDPGAKTTVEIRVERNGANGPIEIRVDGAPTGITATNVTIDGGASTASLEIHADQKLGDEPLSATLQVKAKAASGEATTPLALTVNKVAMPTFAPVSGVILQPGGKATAKLVLERNGYEGPLDVKIENLPAKVTAKAAPFAAGQNESTLEVAAAGDAPNSSQKVRIVATRLGRTVAVEAPVQIDNRPFQVKSFMVVQIKPGEKKTVEMAVERRSYKGPIDLEAKDLPEGVTAAKTQVAADQTSVSLELSALANAHERVRSVKIVSSGGGLTRVDPMVVRVSHGETGALPREITADPELLPLLRRGSFGGRLTAKSKQALLEAYGGTPESEEAVLRGLRWLAAHQKEDGRWSLKNYHEGHLDCDCHTDFEKEVVDADSAGTGFGLLPFLGAGITHSRAPESPSELAQYQKVVERGIAYLVKNQVSPKDAGKDQTKAGNLGGNLYAHVVGAMALCEAYGLSRDERLKVPAQLAVRYMVEAQHSEGGWRYGPKQPGDLSATAWMFLGIRNGQLAALSIDRNALDKAEKFIDACGAGPEDAKLSRYAYQPEQGPKLSLTAAGLLTREYLGWKRDNPNLLAGSRYLMENLPPESSSQLGPIYYHYYATQVLHHLEGADFDLWNHRMREHLIRTQEKEGHKAGSWTPEGSDWGSKGGRLYSTSLALMTLQVYYRHLPLYKPVTRTLSP